MAWMGRSNTSMRTEQHKDVFGQISARYRTDSELLDQVHVLAVLEGAVQGDDVLVVQRAVDLDLPRHLCITHTRGSRSKHRVAFRERQRPAHVTARCTAPGMASFVMSNAQAQGSYTAAVTWAIVFGSDRRIIRALPA